MGIFWVESGSKRHLLFKPCKANADVESTFGTRETGCPVSLSFTDLDSSTTRVKASIFQNFAAGGLRDGGELTC